MKLVKLFTYLTITIFFTQSKTFASDCPENWTEAVQIVAESKKVDQRVVFISEKGDVFNCLHEQISQQDIQSIQEREGRFSAAVLLRRPSSDEEFPLNVCNTAKFLDPKFGVEYGIYLPLDLQVVGKKKCLQRISEKVNRLFKVERNGR
ncbi:hypothetical protein IWQ52_002042 [Labrenzia sp. EL_159]|nr:hypothetical protein [Labrenzia sp. EL_162]MBG6194528.1 hypothetical protein [Labrenzia sp. EL_159]